MTGAEMIVNHFYRVATTMPRTTDGNVTAWVERRDRKGPQARIRHTDVTTNARAEAIGIAKTHAEGLTAPSDWEGAALVRRSANVGVKPNPYPYVLVQGPIETGIDHSAAVKAIRDGAVNEAGLDT